MLEPKGGAKLSDGCDAVSQLFVSSLPYAPGPGLSPAEGGATPGLVDLPPETSMAGLCQWGIVTRAPGSVAAPHHWQAQGQGQPWGSGLAPGLSPRVTPLLVRQEVKPCLDLVFL